jgi:hypothetical protein
MYRKTDWGEYREKLQARLQGMSCPDTYESADYLEKGVHDLEEAIRATTEEVVPLSKPSPQWKRWFTPELKTLRNESAKLQRTAYHHRFKLDHPVHEAARAAEKKYSKVVEAQKAQHWWAWLANLDQSGL